MTKKDHTPIPRYRAFGGPAILAQGFRPFFLLAGLWAVLALALSFEMIQGRIELPTGFSAISWHYHEMLFGYVAATIGGFLLTAIPNWTGHLPLQGAPLFALVFLWLAGRIAMLISGTIGAWPTALIDISYLLALGGVAFREIVAGRNWRNLPVVAAVFLLLICNALSHAEAIGVAESDGVAPRLSIAVIITLICLVGGRIIPSFTRNWLVKRGLSTLPASFGTFDRMTLAATILSLVYWTIVPDSTPTAILTGLAALLNLGRLSRWCGSTTFPEPLLWILHIGYLWIPLGLGLLTLGHWLPDLAATGALHALTSGAIGTMTLAVMSRATLGHTGHALLASKGLTIAFLLITIAAVLRVGAALLTEMYQPMVNAAAIAWIAAFVTYLGVCGPMLLAQRPSGTRADR